MSKYKINIPGSHNQIIKTNQGGINYYSGKDDKSQAESTKIKILVLASNPEGTNILKLPREIRDLTEIIKKSPDRDRFIVKTRLAVRPQDLQEALLTEKPRIVHFCGHGEGEKGLVLEDDLGRVHLVSTEALADLFGHFSQQIECVLLNACYTQVQAEEIAKHINFVIGMRQPILDRSAIFFTKGFYGALGAGESIPRAYALGCNRIHIESSNSSVRRNASRIEELQDPSVFEHSIPLLFQKETPSKIEQLENSSTMETESPAKNNSISFGDNTSVGRDVVGGDRIQHAIYQFTRPNSNFSPSELLELLTELKSCLKQASFDEDEKDMAAGEVTKAIRETKQTNSENIDDKKEKIATYLNEIKTILDRVKNVGEIGEKAFPLLERITTIIGIPFL